MKKALAIILAIALLLAFAACDATNSLSTSARNTIASDTFTLDGLHYKLEGWSIEGENTYALSFLQREGQLPMSFDLNGGEMNKQKYHLSAAVSLDDQPYTAQTITAESLDEDDAEGYQIRIIFSFLLPSNAGLPQTGVITQTQKYETVELDLSDLAAPIRTEAATTEVATIEVTTAETLTVEETTTVNPVTTTAMPTTTTVKTTITTAKATTTTTKPTTTTTKPTTTAGPRSVDLLAASQNREISVSARGINIECTSLTITNNTSEDLKITIAPGTYFNSYIVQNMMIIHADTLDVGAGQTKTFDVTSACMNIDRSIPGGSNSFTLSQSYNTTLRNLVQLMEENPQTQPVRQAAVWILTDNATFADTNILRNQYGIPVITWNDYSTALNLVRQAAGGFFIAPF